MQENFGKFSEKLSWRFLSKRGHTEAGVNVQISQLYIEFFQQITQSFR